jgi:biopolymer transport protein ExbD
MSPSKKRARDEEDEELNITSLMDAFTIVLIFLIKQYGASVIDIAEGYTPPTAETRLEVDRVLSVQLRPAGPENVIAYRIGTHAEKLERKDARLGYQQLRRDLIDEKVMVDAVIADENLKGAINLVGDRNLRYDTVMDIMQAAAGAGFFKLKLVAQP